jgi:hypothetical protein
MNTRRPKFRRAEYHTVRRRITERSLAIIGAVSRLRFAPTSLILPLVAGNPAVTHRHLRDLYDLTLVNRFVLPRVTGPAGEFIYYLDNPKALELLAQATGEPVDSERRESIWRNREKAYADLLDPAKSALRPGSLLFVEHELMISRFHAMLELACRESKGVTKLALWRQGAELWDSVQAPKLNFDEKKEEWRADPEASERLPHRPDAFFTLEFPGNPEGERRAHFFYEADRATTSSETFRNKLRAYFQFIVRQRKHRDAYGITRVRAVLVETLNRPRVKILHSAARHPTVSGQTPSPLFWFTISELFTKKFVRGEADGPPPAVLARPERVLEKIWLPAAGPPLHSLLD